MTPAANYNLPSIDYSVPMMAVNNLSVSDNNRKTKYLTADELSQQTGIPVDELLLMASHKEVPCRFVRTHNYYLFHPDAAMIICGDDLDKYRDTTSTVKQRIKTSDVSESNRSDKNISALETEDIEKDSSPTQQESKKTPIDFDKFKAINEISKQVNKNINNYCIVDKRERSQLCSAGLTVLKNIKDSNVIPDYVTQHSLNVIKQPKRKYYQLDLRGKEPYQIKLRKNLKVKSMVSLVSDNYKEACLIANKKIHDKQLSNGESSDLFIDNELVLNHALILGMKKNSNEDKKTIKGMQQKLGFWSYVSGTVKLELINHHFIIAILDQMREGGFMASTRNAYAVELRKSLQQSYDNELIDKMPSIPSFQSNRRGLIELPWKDVWLPFIESYAINKEEELFLKLIWHFAHRHTNVNNLTIGQIDYTNRIVHFARSEHKSNEMMDVPLSEDAIDIIEELKSYNQSTGYTGDKLFPNINGINKKRWDKTIKKLSLDSNLVLHHVRHYFITDMLRNGASREDVAKAAGYKSVEGMKRYDHTGVTKSAQEAVNKRTGINKQQTESSHDKIITINNNLGGNININ